MQATGKDTFHSLWYNVFKRITTDDNGKLSEAYEGREITPDDVLLELEGFNASDHAIIVIDEFDRISSKKARVLFSDLLKTLSDTSVASTLVCIGVAETISELIHDHESVVRTLIQVEMPRMTGREIRNIVQSRLKKCGMLIADSALKQIAFISKGMPYYAHLLGLHASQASCDRRSIVIELSDVITGIDRALNDVSSYIVSVYDQAAYSDYKEVIFREVLLACALAKRDSFGRFSARSVAEQLNKILPGKVYDVPQFAYHLKSFCDERRGHILQQFGSTRNFRYRFKETLMEPFVLAQSLRHKIIGEEQLRKIIPEQVPDLFSF